MHPQFGVRLAHGGKLRETGLDHLKVRHVQPDWHDRPDGVVGPCLLGVGSTSIDNRDVQVAVLKRCRCAATLSIG
jgi:hypothetical protein